MYVTMYNAVDMLSTFSNFRGKRVLPPRDSEYASSLLSASSWQCTWQCMSRPIIEEMTLCCLRSLTSGTRVYVSVTAKRRLSILAFDLLSFFLRDRGWPTIEELILCYLHSLTSGAKRCYRQETLRILLVFFEFLRENVRDNVYRRWSSMNSVTLCLSTCSDFRSKKVLTPRDTEYTSSLLSASSWQCTWQCMSRPTIEEMTLCLSTSSDFRDKDIR